MERWTSGGQPQESGDNLTRTCGPSCGRCRTPKLPPETPCRACPTATRHLLVTGNGDRPGGRPPGRGRQRETAGCLGFTGTGDGFRGMDRRAIAWTAPVTRPATTRPERSGRGEAGQSRAGGPRVIAAGSAGHRFTQGLDLSDQDRATTRSGLRGGVGPERSGPEATRGTRTVQVLDPSDRDRRATGCTSHAGAGPERSGPVTTWGSSTEVPGPSDRDRSPTEGTAPRRWRSRAIGTAGHEGHLFRDGGHRAIGARASGAVRRGRRQLRQSRARRTGEAPPTHAWRGLRRVRADAHPSTRRVSGLRSGERFGRP